MENTPWNEQEFRRISCLGMRTEGERRQSRFRKEMEVLVPGVVKYFVNLYRVKLG